MTTTGGITIEATENAGIRAISAAASVAIGAGGYFGGGVAGAGAYARNEIYTKTNAGIESSTVESTNGAVFLHATDTSTIKALIAAVALGVGAGTAGLGVAIGVSFAENVIGTTSAFDYLSDQTLATGLTAGKTVRIAAGRNAGDVYRYKGSAVSGTVILGSQNYADTSKWELVGAASGAQAFVAGSSVLGKALTIWAMTSQTIDALVLAGSVSIAAGGGAFGLAGSGSVARNVIAARAAAYIYGDGAATTGITVDSVAITASDSSTINAITGAAAIAASIGGAFGVGVAIGVAIAWNTIANEVLAYIANADTKVKATTSTGITISATEGATIHAWTVAASLSIAVGSVGAGVSGAGAAATNAIFTKVNAHIDDSVVESSGPVNATAMNTASIEAKVFAVAAAVGAGATGLGVAIGVSVARNFIGFDPSGGPSYSCTLANNCYESTATTSTITTGKRVKVVTGARTGDVYEYVGTTTLTNKDLTMQEYGDASLWKQVLIAPNAAQVQAYVLRSSVDATGQLKLQATSTQTIDAIVVAGAVALSGGGAGVSVSGAGVFVENKIATAVKAFIDGDGAAGISAHDILITADDGSSIRSIAGAASVAAAIGAVGVSIAIGLAIAFNEVSDDVAAFIRNADTKVEAKNGDVKVSATSHGSDGVTLNGVTDVVLDDLARTEQDDPATSAIDEAAVDAVDETTRLIALDNAFRNAGRELQYGFAYTTGSGTKTLSPGTKVLVSPGYALGGTPGSSYIYIGASGSFNLAAQNYADTTKWALASGSATYTTASGTHTLNKGNSVTVAAGYLNGGTPGDTYTYVGPNGASIDLGLEDYNDGARWSSWAAPARYASLTTLNKGDTVKVAAGYGGGGTPGLVYRFIGTNPTTVNLATQNYASGNWERVLPTVTALSDTSWQVVGGTDVYIVKQVGNALQVSRATIDAVTVAASVALAGGVGAGVAVSGAGAYAENVVLTKTNAFIQDSKVTQATNVDLDATASASISALVASLSAAIGIGVGAAGIGASIGLSIARNFIGFDPSAPGYTCTAPACYLSTAATSTITPGKRVQIASGDRAGEVYEYVGGTTLTNPNLSTQDYTDTSKWKQIAPNAAEIQAYVKNSSISASGALTADAASSQAIAALVVAGSVAVGAGAVVGVGFSGAGVFAENRIATYVKAFIDGDGTASTGITVGSVALHATDASAIAAFAGAVSVAFALGGAAGVSISIGVSLARNQIESEIAAYIANADTTVTTNSGDIVVSADEGASIKVIAAAASVAAGLGLGVGIGASGAGADASNVILGRTSAFVEDSKLTSAGDVDITATNHATIDAIVGAFSAALGVGIVGAGVSIGIALARNVIGWKATSNNPTTTYDSDQTGATLTPNVTTVEIANGPGKGDVFMYIGPSRTGVDLRQADYRNPAFWKQINLTSSAAPVQAYIERSSVSATSGDLSLEAMSDESIHAFVLAASAALSGGVVGLGLSGAGAAAENRINMNVQAYIDGDGATGISAQNVSLTASDEPTIDAFTGAAALALSVGVIAGSVAIGVALAKNEISNQVLAYIANADGSPSSTTDYGVTASQDITLEATNDATITSTTFAAAAAAGVGLGSFALAGAGADALNVILTKTKAYVDSSDLTSTGDVSITADDTSHIDAHVKAFAASVSIGIVAGAVSIGIAKARNFIGYTAQATPQAAEVQAYVTNSSVDAGGSLEISASEDATIDADISSTSIGVSAGLIAVAASGAGVTIENKVNVLAKAYIGTTRNGGIDAFDVTIEATDTSHIDATATAVSFSVSVGVVSGSVAISVSLAQNTIQTDVEAYATSASIATTTGDLTITATEDATITSDATASAVAAGVTFSVAGGGATSNATITTITRAYADPVELDIADDVQIDAIATTTATTTATGHATSASFIGLSGATTTATSTINPTVESRLGGYTTGTTTASADDDIFVGSTLAASATATAEGGSFGTTVSAGGATATATIEPSVSTTPMVQSGISGGTVVSTGGGITVKSIYNTDEDGKVTDGSGARAIAHASSGSILISTSGASATATDKPYVDTYVSSGATLSALGEIKISSGSVAVATATGSGSSGGIAGIGKTTTSSNASGHVTTRMDGSITSGTNVDVKAISADKATATSQAVSGGLFASTKNTATAVTQGNVEAHIGGVSTDPSIITVTGTIELEAKANPEADSDTRGVSVGGITVGGSESNLTVSPVVLAYIGAGSQIQAGSLSLRATAEPSGTEPTFVIESVSNANDTLTVRKHGLETGDAVEYDPQSHTVIVGLQGPTNEEVHKEDGTVVNILVNRQYNVIALGGDTIAFGNDFDTADVNGTFDTITFPQPHNFVTGDKVRFIGTTAGGLTSDGTYWVRVIDERTIKLTTTEDMARHPENYLKPFAGVNVSGNVITIASNGFSPNQAVTYYAPAGNLTFHSTQVDTTVTLDGETVTAFNVSPGSDNIYFAYQSGPNEGNRLPHGLQTNDKIIYTVTAVEGKSPVPIGGLTPGQTYTVIKVNDYEIQLKHSSTFTNGAVTLIRSGSGDQIIRSSGSWVDNGFIAGEQINISGAFSGTFTIQTVSALTLTLTATNTIPATRVVNGSFTFTRAANTNAGQHDTIVRSSGSWTSEGFATGQSITVTGANAGTYTLTGVTATELQIAPQTFPVGFAASGTSTVDRGTVNITLDEQGHILLTPAKSTNISVQADLIRRASGGDQIVRTSGDVLTSLVNGQPITIAGIAGSFTISTVSGNTITLTQSSVLPKATQVTDTFTFTRSGSATTGTDTIVRSTGSWVADGFLVGMQVTLTTTNAGTYSLVGVSATTLELGPQSLAAGFSASGSATVSRGAVSVLIEDPRNDTHSIVKAGDVPIGGLISGQTYYVTDLGVGGAGKFKLAPTLADAQNASGARVTLTPTTIAGTGQHMIGTQGVDLSSVDGQLRIQIDTDTVTSEQKILAPGGGSLSLVSTPPGDGLSSAKAKGSGGAVFTLGSNNSTVTSSPSVTAYVGNGAFVSLAGSASITSTSSTNLSAWAKNGSGGLIAIGHAEATVNQTGNTSNAYVDENARIIAVDNFTLSALSSNTASSSGEATAAGGIGVADSDSTTTIKYTTTASLKQNSDVLAGGFANVNASTTVNGSATAYADGKGFGADGHADANMNVGQSNDATKAATTANVDTGASLNATRTRVAATVSSLVATSSAKAYGAGFYGEGFGTGNTNVYPTNTVNIGNGAQITGYEGVDILARFWTDVAGARAVDTDAYGFARATGLFGFVESHGNNSTTLVGTVNGSTSTTNHALVTAGPRDPDVNLTDLAHPGTTRLALFVDTSNSTVRVHRDADVSRRALAAGDSHTGGSGQTETQTIPWGTTDVTILSGRSPVLVIEDGGLISKAVEVTVHDTVTNTDKGQGDTISAGVAAIVVNDISNPGPGNVLMRADTITGGDGSQMTNNQLNGTWTYVDTLSSVRITNNWAKDLKVNNINVVGTGVPTVTLSPSDPGLRFIIVRRVSGSLVDIENNATSNVLLNGTINNPVGVTELVNVDGDIRSTHDRFTTDGTSATGAGPCGGSDGTPAAGRYSIVCTNVIDIRTPDGSIGQSTTRLNLDLVDSTGNPGPTQFTTGRVNSVLDTIFLGPHSLFTGEEVRYNTVLATTTAITGLAKDGVYYVIALDDGMSIKLASSRTNAVAGIALQLAPDATQWTQKHTLTPLGRFSADASGDVWMDIRAHNRNTVATASFTGDITFNGTTITRTGGSFVTDGFLVGDTIHIGGGTPYDGDYTIKTVTASAITLTTTTQASSDARTGVTVTSQYTVKIDHITAGGNIDLLLRPSVRQTGTGTSGGVLVNGTTYYTFYRKSPDTAPGLDGGAYGQGSTTVASTYDFRSRDVSGTPTLPALTVTGNGYIRIDTSDYTSTDSTKVINILGLTEITGAGTGYVDVRTNGWIGTARNPFAEYTDDLQVGRIISTRSNVFLAAPKRILDQLNDSDADVSGVNITMTAGTGLLVGGIGTRSNFLEIDVDLLNGVPLGVLNAWDRLAADRGHLPHRDERRPQARHRLDARRRLARHAGRLDRRRARFLRRRRRRGERLRHERRPRRQRHGRQHRQDRRHERPRDRVGPPRPDRHRQLHAERDDDHAVERQLPGRQLLRRREDRRLRRRLAVQRHLHDRERHRDDAHAHVADRAVVGSEERRHDRRRSGRRRPGGGRQHLPHRDARHAPCRARRGDRRRHPADRPRDAGGAGNLAGARRGDLHRAP